jgi:hypothetical protein
MIFTKNDFSPKGKQPVMIMRGLMPLTFPRVVPLLLHGGRVNSGALTSAFA